MSFPSTIVFVPGLLCDALLWRAQVEHLRGQADTIIGDTLHDDSIEGMAARILGTAPPGFALCALSMGGYVAMEIMRQAPQRVSHLVLCDTTARQDTEEMRQRRLDFIALARRGKFRGVTPRLLPQLLAPESLGKPEITNAVMIMAETLGVDIYLKQQAAIMGRIDSRPSLKQVSCPAMVCVGESDTTTPPELAEEMAGLIPGAKLQIIKGAGHLPPLESPEEFNRILIDFLKN